MIVSGGVPDQLLFFKFRRFGIYTMPGKYFFPAFAEFALVLDLKSLDSGCFIRSRRYAFEMNNRG